MSRNEATDAHGTTVHLVVYSSFNIACGGSWTCIKVYLMARTLRELMLRGATGVPLSPLESALYYSRMSSLKSRGSPAPEMPMMPNEGFKYWVENIRSRVDEKYDSVIIVTGVVGCHAAGQGILMHDGTIKNVEEIIVGDLLMGPDSTYRTVLELYRGNDEMIEVIPTKTAPFVVNAHHMLTTIKDRRTAPLGITHRAKRGSSDGLWRTGFRRPREVVSPSSSSYQILSNEKWLIDRPVTQYSKRLNKPYKLLQAESVTFGGINSCLPLNPRLLGLMLADGGLSDANGLSYTKSDTVLLNFVKATFNAVPREYHKRGCVSLRWNQKTEVAAALRQLGLLPIRCEQRFIPSLYLRASARQRMELLSGLIDGDGCVSPMGMCYYTSKSEQLCRDVAFLSRSMGFKTSLRSMIKADQNGTKDLYWETGIIGDTIRLRLMVSRKRARLSKHNTFKDFMVEGFTTKSVGVGEYFGFRVSGDGRYLMDNFIITHNSGKSTYALRLSQALEPDFDMSRLCYSAADLIAAYKTIRPGQVVLFDESVRGLQAGDQSSKEQKTLIQALVLIREKGAVLILCCPDIFLVAKQIRQKRATLWIHCHDRPRGVAEVFFRNDYLRFEPDNTLGFLRSRRAPLLMWKRYAETDPFWRSYQDTKHRKLDDFLEETEGMLRKRGGGKDKQASAKPKSTSAERMRRFRKRREGGDGENVQRVTGDFGKLLEDEDDDHE